MARRSGDRREAGGEMAEAKAVTVDRRDSPTLKEYKRVRRREEEVGLGSGGRV